MAVTDTLDERLTESAVETEAIAAEVAAGLRCGDLLLLAGELGAGKTTFVRGLAQALGVLGPVQSPTFTLVRVYRGPLQLAHVDLYRLEGQTELGGLGLDDLLDEGVVVVEWGDRLTTGYERSRRIEFEHAGGDRRRIRLL